MTSTIETKTKSPSEILDYVVDWSRWLTANDAIASVVWTVPSSLTQPTAATNTTTTATVWLGAGVDGSDYVVECSITTTQGRTASAAFLLRVRS